MGVAGGLAVALAVALSCAGASAEAAPKPALAKTAKAAPLPMPAVPLSLENAKPVAVPPAPRIAVPSAPPAPAAFAAPKTAPVPPVPNVVAVRETAPAPIPVTTPALPSSLQSVPALPPAPAPVAKAVEPPPAAKTAEPPPAQVAALPPPQAPQRIEVPALPDGALTVEFARDSDQVPSAASSLIATLAVRLQAEPNLRLQLRSYAQATDDPRDARRISLNRAMAVRERLVAAGVRSTRVDVRALGAGGADATAGGAPADRIDIDILNK